MRTHSHSPELVNKIERLLRGISTIVKQKGREILTRFPITPPQFTALIYLMEEGDLTIGELSQKMCLACSTMTDLIDRMEKSGFVTRIRDDRDRRVVRIHMTERGETIIRDVMQARQEYLADKLGHFSPEEIKAIGQHLELLYERMKD